MQQLDTGFEAATRLLNVVISSGVVVFGRRKVAWLHGRRPMDINYRFLAAKSGVDVKQVPTTLMYLRTAGYINALFDCNPNHSARIALCLSAGAQLT
jgi:hypothetical protein